MGVTEFDFQPDPKKPTTHEIATAATDYDMFQGFLDHIPNPDEVLRLECGGDITVYDNIGRDPRISSNLGTRARAVVGKEWDIVPYSQETIDIQIQEYVRNVYLDFPFDRSRRSMLRGGTLKGFAVGEVMWDYSEGDTFITNIFYRHQRRFTFNQQRHLLLKTIANPLGENVTIRDGLPLKKFQVITFGDEVETPWGIGLGRELYWPWWFKKNDIKDWLLSGNKFAAPTVVGEYDKDSTNEIDQNKLLAAAQAVHSRSSIIYPKGMILRLMESVRNGSINTYRELVDFLNEEITICILGQTATTTGTPGKLGNEKEQGKVFEAIIKADADSECEAYNARDGGMIRWLVDYQFPGHGRYPKIWVDCEEEEDKKTLAERDQALADAMQKGGKYRLTKAYFIRTQGLQKDDIEEMEPTIPLVSKGREISFADPATSGTEGAFPDQAALDAALAAITPAEMQGRMEPVVKPVLAGFQQSGNVDEAMERLIEAYPLMDTTQLEELLARMIFVAECWGRLNG